MKQLCMITFSIACVVGGTIVLGFSGDFADHESGTLATIRGGLDRLCDGPQQSCTAYTEQAGGYSSKCGTSWCQCATCPVGPLNCIGTCPENLTIKKCKTLAMESCTGNTVCQGQAFEGTCTVSSVQISMDCDGQAYGWRCTATDCEPTESTVECSQFQCAVF